MNLPRQDQVGLLMPLTCGHNGRPSDVETLIFGIHLDQAGFMSKDSFEIEQEEESSIDESAFRSIDDIPVRYTPSNSYVQDQKPTVTDN